MQVVLVGAGAVGEVIARHLSNDNKISLSIADIDPASIRRIKRKLTTKKVETHLLDVRNSDNLSKLLKDAELLINAATPKINTYLMKECLKRNVNYMDLASDDVYEQLAMNDMWRDKRLKALICMGEDPGLSNIYAKYAADKINEPMYIKIRDGEFSETTVNYHFVPLFSPQVFLEELLSPAYYYMDGKYISVKPLSKYEEYNFPQPIGKKTFYLLDHEEIWTLPKFIKHVKYVDFMLAISPELVSLITTLKRMKMTKKQKIKIGSSSVAPIDVIIALTPKPSYISKYIRGYAGISVEVAGRNSGLKSYTLYTTVSHEFAYKHFQTNATGYLTGTVPAVIASSLARGEIELGGVICPEQLDPEPIIRKLKKENIITYIKSEDVSELDI